MANWIRNAFAHGDQTQKMSTQAIGRHHLRSLGCFCLCYSPRNSREMNKKTTFGSWLHFCVVNKHCYLTSNLSVSGHRLEDAMRRSGLNFHFAMPRKCGGTTVTKGKSRLLALDEGAAGFFKKRLSSPQVKSQCIQMWQQRVKCYALRF